MSRKVLQTCTIIALMLLLAAPASAQQNQQSDPATDSSGETNYQFTPYDHLTDDDFVYNKKSSLLVPLVEVPLTNGVVWSYDRYGANASYAQINMDTIQHNFQRGWWWDTDDFPTNFSLHPYFGSAYFNCARSNGYNFYESAPFVLGGSVMWELFMENTRPSYNDLINTTFSGIFLGEVLYRLSSNILDDQTTGPQRVFREFAATLVDPVRGFNRLLQGKMFRVTPYEVYQKEPVYFTIALGARRINNLPELRSDPLSSAMLNVNISYGNPYEVRSRKPFDYFTLRADLVSGDIKHIANDVIGDGYIFGGNVTGHNWSLLMGGFHHYDYWNTTGFEIGTVGFGPGLLAKRKYFQNEFHLAAVPLGASNARKTVVGELNPGYHNYTYSGGAELKYSALLNFGFGHLGVDYYLYWLHTYAGEPGDNLIGILRPVVSIKLYHALNIGYEYFLYKRRDTNGQGPTVNVTTNEQRLYLLFDFR